MNLIITPSPINAVVSKCSANGNANANTTVIINAIAGTPYLFFLVIICGKTPLSANAVNARGAPNDAATLIPNIEITAPKTTNFFNIGCEIALANPTVSFEFTILSDPNIIPTKTTNTYTVATIPIVIGIALGNVLSGSSISSAALAIDSNPVNAYNENIVPIITPANGLLPITSI